jgi:hypothetical protein
MFKGSDLYQADLRKLTCPGSIFLKLLSILVKVRSKFENSQRAV